MKIPVDVISGFLGAGKTTLIRKLLNESYKNQQVFLLENEYGEVGIDGTLLADRNVEMREIYSGCICCSLKGDFTRVLLETLDNVKPERIIIEPTGVGKLSEIINILQQDVFKNKLAIEHLITVVDAQKALIYLKNFGEFFKDQVKHAKTLILSKTKGLAWQEVEDVVRQLKPLNHSARWVTTAWEEFAAGQILKANIPMENLLMKDLPPIIKLPTIINTCGCEHHHKHTHAQTCGCNHLGHQQHNAPDVFQSWSWESPKKFTTNSLEVILSKLKEKRYGQILRAKGIIPSDNEWLHFEYVSGDWDVVGATPQLTGRSIVIGVDLQEDQLKQLFES